MRRSVLLLVMAMFTVSFAVEPIKFKVMFVNSNKLKIGESIISRGDTIDEKDEICWSNNKQVVKVMNLQNKNEKFVFTAADAQHISGNSIGLYAEYLRNLHSGFKQQRAINTFERNHLSAQIPLPPGPPSFIALLDTLEIDIPSQEALTEIRERGLYVTEVQEIMYQFRFSGKNTNDDFNLRRDTNGNVMSGSGLILRGFEPSIPITNGIGKLLITKEIYKNDIPADGLLRLLIDYGVYSEEYMLCIHPVSSDLIDNE